jgi:hypothetical protein
MPQRLLVVIAVILLAGGGLASQSAQPALDTAAIDKGLGLTGTMQGDVYRVGMARTDLAVAVRGVAIKPGLALGSWAAFRRAGARAVVHGDLVATATEVNPLISRLQAGGFMITALHNHLIEETPAVMYLHYWGEGGEATLASSLRNALQATRTPLTPPPPAPATPPKPDFDVDALQTALGRTGTVRGGVLGVSVPRPEKIMMMGVELPPSMGMATALNFQAGAAGKIVATGDFVLAPTEVNAVARVLRDRGIAITALHNHMLHGTPDLYFMHFWADGTVADVGAGLKAALDRLPK